MNSIHALRELFRRFPGIGPRQATRFVYFLLRQDKGYIQNLIREIDGLSKNVRVCSQSYQYFYSEDPSVSLSPIARDESRDGTLLMIVEKDTDLEAIEKTKLYRGYYFVLGGTLPVLEKDLQKFIRAQELERSIAKKVPDGLREVILALSATPEGEHTSDFVRGALTRAYPTLAVSILARGLSTGTELEYIDTETMKSALHNRQ